MKNCLKIFSLQILRAIPLLALFILFSCSYKNNSKDVEDNLIPSQNSPTVQKTSENNIDSTAGFLTSEGRWIDTIIKPGENSSSYNGVSYYPNFTAYLPQTVEEFSNPYRDIKAYVKTDKQQPVKWIYPLEESELFNGRNVEITKITAINNHSLSVDIKIDRNKEYRSIVGDDQISISTGQLSNNLFYCQLIYYITDGVRLKLAKTEISYYDSQGNQFVHIIRDGSISSNITPNKKYLYLSGGGLITENTKLPFTGAIYDIENKEYIWEKTFNCKSIGVGTYDQISNTIWIKYYLEGCANPNDSTLLVLFNTDSNKIYKYISYEKALPARVSLNNKNRLYYTVKEGEKWVKKYLTLEEDFKLIDELP